MTNYDEKTSWVMHTFMETLLHLENGMLPELVEGASDYNIGEALLLLGINTKYHDLKELLWSFSDALVRKQRETYLDIVRKVVTLAQELTYKENK